MPKDDPAAVEVVRQQFKCEGIEVAEAIKVLSVEKSNAGLRVVISANSQEQRIDGSHLLVATGRRPNVENLGLEAAGVTLGSCLLPKQGIGFLEAPEY